MSSNEIEPGARAPHAGFYEELNVFGSPTGNQALMDCGERLPGAPRGFMWRPLAERSVAELRDKAAGYRRMAATASTAQVMRSLHKLAERLEALAAQREQGG